MNGGRHGNLQVRGYPAQSVEDDLYHDYNSDGIFDYESDLLPTYRREFPVVYTDDNGDAPTGGASGNDLSDVKCSVIDPKFGSTAVCGLLAGDFAPSPPPGTSGVAGGQTIGNRRRQVSDGNIDKVGPPSSNDRYMKREMETIRFLRSRKNIKATSHGLRPVGPGPKNPRRKTKSTRTLPVLQNYPPPPPTTTIIQINLLETYIEIDTTNISTIVSPLGFHLRRFSDYTQQLILEALFGYTLVNFPTPEQAINPELD